MTTTLHVHFDGKVLVPEGPVDLPTGHRLEVVIIDTENNLAPGSPAVLLYAMQHSPRLSSADVDELERAIEQGKLPVRHSGEFDE